MNTSTIIVGKTAPITGNRVPVLVDSSGRLITAPYSGIPVAAATQTITTGGTAQTVFAASSRVKLAIFNLGTDLKMITVDGSTPSATNGIPLTGQGSSYTEEGAATSSAAIKIWSASTGGAFHALQTL